MLTLQWLEHHQFPPLGKLAQQGAEVQSVQLGSTNYKAEDELSLRGDVTHPQQWVKDTQTPLVPQNTSPALTLPLKLISICSCTRIFFPPQKEIVRNTLKKKKINGEDVLYPKQDIPDLLCPKKP